MISNINSPSGYWEDEKTTENETNNQYQTESIDFIERSHKRKHSTDIYEDVLNQREDISINQQSIKKIYIERVSTLHKSNINVDSLDNISNMPPLQKTFAHDENSKILLLDVGTGALKAGKTITGLVSPRSTNYMFKNGNQYLPYALYYCKNTQEYTLDMHKVSEDPSSYIEFKDIKRLFLVQSMMQIELEGISFNVTEVIVSLLYLAFKQLVQKEIVLEDGRKSNDLSSFTHFIISCPTDTSNELKQVYRKVIHRSLHMLGVEISLEQIYIVEEFIPLHYLCRSEETEPGCYLYVDTGKGTTDVTLISFDEESKSFKLLGRKGFFNALFVLHDLLVREKKITNQQAEALICEQFDSNLEEPIAALKDIEGKIFAAFQMIVDPLILYAFENSVKKIHYAGAVVNCPFFRKIIKEILSVSYISNFLQERKRYFKKEFKEKSMGSFQLHFAISGTSCLIEGLIKMIASSNGDPQLLEIEDCKTSKTTYKVVMLQEKQFKKKKNKLILTPTLACYSLYALQDFEIFIVGFNSLIDADRISEINCDNFKLLGIDEFQRFSAITLMFDRESISTTNLNFLVKAKVNPNTLVLKFYFSHVSQYYLSVLEIDRKGRVESLPVCGIEFLIFNTIETDIKMWYGLNYYLKYVIRYCSANRCKVEKVPKKLQFKIAPTMKDNTYDRQIIPQLTEGDYEKVKSQLSLACVSCATEIGDSNHYITPLTLLKYKKAFNNQDLICGKICKKCYSIYSKSLKPKVSTLTHLKKRKTK